MTTTTRATVTYTMWHNELCAYARTKGGSASTDSAWMHLAYRRGYTPADAWDAFTNNERI